MADRPEPSQGLKDAIAFARRTDPDFPAKVKRLAEQDFKPLAVIQRGIESDRRCPSCRLYVASEEYERHEC